MGFWRITKNTPNSGQKKTEKHLPVSHLFAFFLHVSFISHLLAFVALVVPNFCFMLALVCFSFFPISPPLPSADPPRTAPPPDRPSTGAPLPRTAQNFALFFFPTPGLHTKPRTPNVHISGPRRFKHQQNSAKGPPRERRKKENCGGRGKKAQHFGPPPFGAPFFLGLGSHPSGPHPSFGAPPSVGLIRIGLSRARPLLSAPTLLPHTGCPPVDPHVFRQAEMVVLKWVLVECGGKICLHKRKDWLTHQCDFPGLAQKETSLCEVVFG